MGRTAGEFGALLRESEPIKTRLPAHNVASRRKSNQVLLSFDEEGCATLRPAARSSFHSSDTATALRIARVGKRLMTELAASTHLPENDGLEGRRKAATRVRLASTISCGAAGRMRRCRGARRARRTPERIVAAVAVTALAARERDRPCRTERRALSRAMARIRPMVLAGNRQIIDRRFRSGAQLRRACSKPMPRGSVQALSARSPWPLATIELASNASPLAATLPLAVALADSARENASAPHPPHRDVASHHNLMMH